MKPGQSQNSAASANVPRGRPTRSNTFTGRHAEDGLPHKAKAAWDPNLDSKAPPPGISRSNTTRAPRKAGFDPGTPGGDEPAASNTSAYFNVSRGERPHVTRPQAYPPPPPGPPPSTTRRPDPSRPDPLRPDPLRPDPLRPSPRRPDPTQGIRSPDPLRTFKSPLSEDPHSSRLSTPYATSGGEKTFFSSDGLYRAASTGSNLHSGWQDIDSAKSDARSPTTAERHRSASPRMRSPNPQYSSPSGSTSSDDDDDDLHERVKLEPRGYGATRNVNVNRAHVDRPPQPSVTIEDEDGTTTELGKPEQRSTWSTEETNGAKAQSKQHPFDQTGPRRTSTSDIPEGVQHRAKHDADRMPHSPLRTTTNWSSEDRAEPLEKSPSWQEKFGYQKDGNNHRQFDRPDTGESKDARPMYDPSLSSCMPSSFINCKVPYWAIPSTIVPQKQTEVHDTAECSSSGQALFPLLNRTNHAHLSRFYFPNESSESSSSMRSQGAEKAKPFSQAEWEKTFSGDASDYLAPQSTGTTNGGRSSPPKGRPAAMHAPSKPPAKETASTIPESKASTQTGPVPAPQPSPAKFSQEQWGEHFKESSWAYPKEQLSPRAGNSRRSKAPRKMSVTNKRPVPTKPINTPIKSNGAQNPSLVATAVTDSDDSTSSNGSAMDIDPKNTPPVPTQLGPNHDPIANIIRSAVPGSRSASKASSKKSSLSDLDSDLNLDSLKDAGPFGTNNTGLEDLRDLHTTLPFDSASSATGPGGATAPRRLALPNPPKAPHAPNKNRLTKRNFDYYMVLVKTYLAEWYIYNKRMLAHFNARQTKNEVELPHNWLESRGEEGYLKYMAGVEEDILVREHWDLSCEKHKAAMETLGELRRVAARGKFMG